MPCTPISDSRAADDHIAIITYWRAFEAHEKSHAHEVLKARFSALARMCMECNELDYDMLWQGEPDGTF